jgi:hypothetical protein
VFPDHNQLMDSARITLVSWLQFPPLPLLGLSTESQNFLTSTLMAQRPMARTAFRTKSTSTSVAYSLSSANTCGPDREQGGERDGETYWNTSGQGECKTLRRMGFCLLVKVEGPEQGESCQMPQQGSTPKKGR